MGFFGKLLSNVAEDWYIFLAALLAVGCLIAIRISNKNVEKSFELWKSENHYSNFIYKTLTICYSVFVTLITIFPLLGMLGTVKSLLILNFADDTAIVNARNSFFDALTSTAWGIIFAIVFKVVNAFISKQTEDNIQKVSELIGSKAVNIDSRRTPEKKQGYEE